MHDRLGSGKGLQEARLDLACIQNTQGHALYCSYPGPVWQAPPQLAKKPFQKLPYVRPTYNAIWVKYKPWCYSWSWSWQTNSVLLSQATTQFPFPSYLFLFLVTGYSNSLSWLPKCRALPPNACYCSLYWYTYRCQILRLRWTSCAHAYL